MIDDNEDKAIDFEPEVEEPNMNTEASASDSVSADLGEESDEVADTEKPTPKKPTHYFIDFENGPAQDLANIGRLNSKDELHFFYTESQIYANIPLAILPGLTIWGDMIRLHKCEGKTKAGDQAVDKLLLTFMGADIGIHRDHVNYVIVSDDKGYGRAMASMQTLFHVNVQRQCPLGETPSNKPECVEINAPAPATPPPPPVVSTSTNSKVGEPALPVPAGVNADIYRNNLEVVRKFLLSKGKSQCFKQVVECCYNHASSHKSASTKHIIYVGLQSMGAELGQKYYKELKSQLK